MDTATINHVSLCSGYGGIDLGLSRAMGRSLRTIAYSEIEAFACANLVAKMEAGLLDSAPIWSDLKSFPWEEFRGLVDIISGGYPCQPFSAAGKRAGKDDPRHLWPWIADGIRIARPRLCFFENVEGHISLGLSTVISDLEELGYRTTWGVFSASEVGAPHQRKRVFILAHLVGTGLEGYARHGYGSGEPRWLTAQKGGSTSKGSAWPSRPGEPQHGWEPPRVVENAAIIGRRGRCDGDEGGSSRKVQAEGPCGRWREDGQTEPALGGNPDGSADRLDHAELYVTTDNRTDELRLLGNGVVPATAERAFLTLLSELAY